MVDVFRQELRVINVGVSGFAEAIRRAGGHALDLEWAPPAGGDLGASRALARLINHASVEEANRKAFAAYLASHPVLEGIGTAGTELPGMGERMILHAGPPVAWEQMCGPMQGAITGAILYEGWAQDRASAMRLAASGEITFAPCHDHNAVGPMAGVISPSMPVWIVTNREGGNRAYSNLNEGLGKVLRFGADSAEVIDRLKWMQRVLAPTLAAVVARLGSLELKPLIAQALHMGDEVHNRNVAASSLLLKKLVPAALSSGRPQADLADVLAFIAANDHFFLNLSMAACKSMMDAAANISGSSMVTAMCRNGVEFGIRLSGTGGAWFTAPAPQVEGLFFSGYGPQDAARDLGDSAITETAGVGGFAMAAAPAIVQFIGGSPRDALAHTLRMAHITLGRNNTFTLPSLDFAGTPACIDARKVADTGIAPIINTGIAHKKAGIGQVGAGITHAPMECFAKALTALSSKLGVDEQKEDRP